MRVVRWGVPLVLLSLLVAGIALVMTSRPDLEDARNDVDTSWDDATTALDDRFTLLATANSTVLNGPGPAGEIAKDVDEALRRWLSSRRDDDRDAGIDAANDLDGLGRRLVLTVRASPRLSADPAVTGPLDQFANAEPPEQLAAFADAVRAYEEERRGPFRGLVADVLGYDAVPTLAVPPSA
jgi:hypothetical protein